MSCLDSYDHDQLLVRLAQEKAHTIWLDNFSKLRPMQIANMEAGTYRSMMWTGRAFRCCRHDVDMAVHAIDQITSPAMPADLFARERSLRVMFANLCQEGMDTCMDHDRSYMQVYNVNAVPLAADLSKVTNPRHAATLRRRQDRLDNMYTDSIQAINIGSNHGLLQILRNHYEEQGLPQHKHNVCQRYNAFNVDVDIFDRILKVSFIQIILSGWITS